MSDLTTLTRDLWNIASALEAEAHTDWHREERRPSGAFSPAWNRLVTLRAARMQLGEIYNELMAAVPVADEIGSAE